MLGHAVPGQVHESAASDLGDPDSDLSLVRREERHALAVARDRGRVFGPFELGQTPKLSVGKGVTPEVIGLLKPPDGEHRRCNHDRHERRGPYRDRRADDKHQRVDQRRQEEFVADQFAEIVEADEQRRTEQVIVRQAQIEAEEHWKDAEHRKKHHDRQDEAEAPPAPTGEPAPAPRDLRPGRPRRRRFPSLVRGRGLAAVA